MGGAYNHAQYLQSAVTRFEGLDRNTLPGSCEGRTAFLMYFDPGNSATVEAAAFDLNFNIRLESSSLAPENITYSWLMRPTGLSSWTEVVSSTVLSVDHSSMSVSDITAIEAPVSGYQDCAPFLLKLAITGQSTLDIGVGITDTDNYASASGVLF